MSVVLPRVRWGIYFRNLACGICGATALIHGLPLVGVALLATAAGLQALELRRRQMDLFARILAAADPLALTAHRHEINRVRGLLQDRRRQWWLILTSRYTYRDLDELSWLLRPAGRSPVDGVER
jgi:hypothetical protein